MQFSALMEKLTLHAGSLVSKLHGNIMRFIEYDVVFHMLFVSVLIEIIFHQTCIVYYVYLLNFTLAVLIRDHVLNESNFQDKQRRKSDRHLLLQVKQVM